MKPRDDTTRIAHSATISPVPGGEPVRGRTLFLVPMRRGVYLQEEFECWRERLLDEVAHHKAAIEVGVEECIDYAIERHRQEFLEDVRDDLADLRAERTAWKTRAETAETLLTDLFRQLWGGATARSICAVVGGGLKASIR
jgi:hypothetical protein